MSDAYGKLSLFLDIFRQCALPPAASGDENTAAMLVYQANTANYMKQLLEMARGEAAVHTQARVGMADGFMELLQDAMGVSL